MAEYGTVTNHWANAATFNSIGADAEQGVLQSLSGFLTANAGTPLADLQGSWGVDPLTSATGTGHSWAIVAGSGIFAVDPDPTAVLVTPQQPDTVPEPGTLVLLAIGAIGLAAVGFRCDRFLVRNHAARKRCPAQHPSLTG